MNLFTVQFEALGLQVVRFAYVCVMYDFDFTCVLNYEIFILNIT
jgi:hypothetical protein